MLVIRWLYFRGSESGLFRVVREREREFKGRGVGRGVSIWGVVMGFRKEWGWGFGLERMVIGFIRSEGLDVGIGVF